MHRKRSSFSPSRSQWLCRVFVVVGSIRLGWLFILSHTERTLCKDHPLSSTQARASDPTHTLAPVETLGRPPTTAALGTNRADARSRIQRLGIPSKAASHADYACAASGVGMQPVTHTHKDTGTHKLPSQVGPLDGPPDSSQRARRSRALLARLAAAGSVSREFTPTCPFT